MYISFESAIDSINTTTVDQEIFAVKIFSSVHGATKIKRAKKYTGYIAEPLDNKIFFKFSNF